MTECKDEDDNDDDYDNDDDDDDSNDDNNDDDGDDVQPLSLDSGGDMVDAYVVVYSVTDRSSFVYAQSCLADLKRRRKTLPPAFRSSAVVLVSNKQDLVRNRVVSESGKLLAL